MRRQDIPPRGKRYDEQFKKDAVDHWSNSKKSAREVVEALAISFFA